jgi:lipoate-protein ligase B
MAEAKEQQELLLAGKSQLQWLEKRKAKIYSVALRLRKSVVMKGWSAEQLNILTERAILNLLDLYKVGKEIAEITIPSKEETESMKAYKKIAKATIASLENRHDSQAKLE